MKMIFTCSLFVEKKFDVIRLQEKHWKDEFIDRYKHLWKGEINYNNNDSSARGVVFLIRNDLKEYVEFVHGFVGRFLHIKYKDNEETFDMINLCIFTKQSCTKIIIFKRIFQI